MKPEASSLDSAVIALEDPAVHACRGYLATLRHAWISDPRGVEGRLRAASRPSFPREKGADAAFLDAVVAVCVATLNDPHDRERAAQRLAREQVSDLDEAVEVLVDWTVRRERGRISRLGRDP